ncbi:MAG TPA: metallophosphoesterase, partial [Polyangium sp.]|nr:metallophosphoesterase [Polyangium sp.]
RDILDKLVSGMLEDLERSDSITAWLLLGRALRDRHNLRPEHRKTILERLVQAWATNPVFEGDVFVVLDDIRVFAKDEVKVELRSACAQVQATGSPGEAIAALYLEEKLFGGVDGAAKRFAARADVTCLLADLVAFHDVPEMAALLAEKSTQDHWEAAFSEPDANGVYRLTLGWIAGTVPCPVRSDAPLLGAIRWLRRKVIAEVTSRADFALAHTDPRYADLFVRPGMFRIQDKRSLHVLTIPLGFVTECPTYSVDLPRSLTNHLLVPPLLHSRFVAVVNGEPLDVPLCDFMAQFIGNELTAFPRREPLPDDLPQLIAKIVAHKFLAGSLREFIRGFAHDLDRSFVRPFVRFPLLYSGLAIASYLCPSDVDFLGGSSSISVMPGCSDRSLERSLGCTLGHFVGYAFARVFGADAARTFIGSFVRFPRQNIDPELFRDLHIDPNAPDMESQLEIAINDDRNVPRVLGSDALWTALARRQLRLSLEPSPEVRTLNQVLHNPFALSRLLSDLATAAAVDWLLAAGRDLHLRYRDGDVPDEMWDAAFAERPISAFWSALAWNEHAKLFRQNHGKLDGAHGALMLAHADYASMMTGIDLENAEQYPYWKNLVDEAGPEKIHALRHYAPALTLTPASVSAPIPTPAPAPAREPAPLFTYLHLSDLHFGLPKPGDRHNQPTVLTALRDEFATLSSKTLPPPEAIFITGDIAYSGKAADYEQASKWIDELLKTLGLTPDCVFVVPGNHDVNRDIDADRKVNRLMRLLRDGDGVDDALVDQDDCDLLLRRKEAYLEFAKRFAPARH